MHPVVRYHERLPAFRLISSFPKTRASLSAFSGDSIWELEGNDIQTSSEVNFRKYNRKEFHYLLFRQ